MHSIRVAIDLVLKDGVAFRLHGVGYYNQFDKERKVNFRLKKLKVSGWEEPVAMKEQLN